MNVLSSSWDDSSWSLVTTVSESSVDLRVGSLSLPLLVSLTSEFVPLVSPVPPSCPGVPELEVGDGVLVAPPPPLLFAFSLHVLS